MSTPLKINYLELPARDPAAARQFYEAAFGWTFEEYGPDYIAFNDGSLDGGFYRSESSSRVSNGATLIILYASDLEDALSRVLANGGTVLRETFSFPGGRRFHFADPNGNEIAVWSE